MFTILVVEDDRSLNKLMCAKLRQEQYTVLEAFDGEEALKVLDNEHVDLILCDVMMPRMDGYEFVKQLRDAGMETPVLMITAKGEMEDIETGFLAGSDDYMVKPIRMKEMSLRVRALLRRAKIASEKKLVIGKFRFDYDALSVMTGEKEETLPKKEFYLLFKLLSNPNRIFTRLELLDEIWGMDAEVDERTVDSHIKKLRRRFESCEEFSIMTVRGLGYKAVIHMR